MVMSIICFRDTTFVKNEVLAEGSVEELGTVARAVVTLRQLLAVGVVHAII